MKGRDTGEHRAGIMADMRDFTSPHNSLSCTLVNKASKLWSQAPIAITHHGAREDEEEDVSKQHSFTLIEHYKTARITQKT